MKSPFLGTKVLDTISLMDIEPLIDREALFVSRWQLSKRRELAITTFERLFAKSLAESILQPKAVYGYFECKKDGNGLIITERGTSKNPLRSEILSPSSETRKMSEKPGGVAGSYVDGFFAKSDEVAAEGAKLQPKGVFRGAPRSFRFDFPREKKEPHRCIADFFSDGFVAMQLATIGSRIVEVGAKLFSRHEYSEMFFLKGLASEAAEATAKFCHRHILAELKADETCGERFSPGYPAFPDLLDQKKIVALLKVARIGVKLTSTCQLIPEYSTSAIVSLDQRATLFRP